MGMALDHLTVVDTTPAMLVEVAAAIGCRAVCPFLTPMAVLPRLPHFNLRETGPDRRDFLAAMADTEVTLDIAYPFTLTGRSEVAGFAPALEDAARLGAWAVNVLVYDREPKRRQERFAAFCALVDRYGLKVVLEFYPQSQVGTLGAAIDLVRGVDAPGRVGVNVDLLHLVRSGGSVTTLAAAPAEWILYGQYCDGPMVQTATAWELEASHHRLLGGEGAFDVTGFAAALPPGCRTSVELPRDDALAAGVPALDRARAAVESIRQTLA